MRRIVVALVSVMICSIGICIFSTLYISRSSDKIDGMRSEVLLLIEQNDLDGAHLRLQQMAEVWAEYEPLLETLARHDDLHEITALIIEANANLESGDLDDFNRSMALLGQAIRHLAAEEQLRLSNIL